MEKINFDSVSNLPPELQKAFYTAQQAEKKSIQAFTERKTKIEAKNTLLKDVIGKVEGLRTLVPSLNTPFAIREFAFQSSDDKTVDGIVDKQYAVPGTYQLEILDLAKSATALSNRFPDKDSTTIGSGYLALRGADGEEKEIFIDEENSTLEGLAKSINTSRVGLKASVVKDLTDPELPFRLVLTGEGTGTENNVEYPEFYFVDGEEEFFIEKEKPAQNGRVIYEGNELEVPSNQLSDLIAGVSLNIKGTTEPGRPISVKVTQDIPKTMSKMKDFVEKTNQVLSFIQTQNSVDEKTDTSKTLGNDYSMRMSESRLREALSYNRVAEPGKKIRTMADLGVQFTKKGILTFDEKKFQASLDAHYDETVEFLAGTDGVQGVIPRLGRALDSLAAPGGGLLNSQQQTEASKIERLEKDIERKEELSQQRLNELRNKLARAQTAISRMKSQGSQLQGPSAGSIESFLL